MLTLRSFAAAALAAVVGLAAAGADAAQDDDIARFYRGKRIKLIIGSGPGGGYDTYARLLARHMGRHIPGNPAFVAQNMEGAGSIVATNFMFNVAPQDGTVIGGLQREIALVQIMGQKGPKYEAARINWLGSLASEAGVCAIMTRTGVKSFDDVFTREFAMGGTGANTTEFYPALFNNLLGARFKLIRGYPSTSNVHLALQRGELDGVCQSWSSFKELGRPLIEAGAVRPVIQVALQPDPEMQRLGVPMLADYITPDRVRQGYTPEDVKTFFRLVLVAGVMGRPFAVGPDVPAARVKALRAAFVATTRDPRFLAEARKLRRDVEPVTGEEIQAIVADVAKTPKAKLAALDGLLKFRGPTQQVKIELVRHTGKVVETVRGGRQIVIDYQGKKVAAGVSGSRTTVTIDGRKEKRGKVKVGMTCTFAYYGPGTQAKEVSCRN